MAKAMGPTQWVNRLASPKRMVFGWMALVVLSRSSALSAALTLARSAVGHRATGSTSSRIANSFEAGGNSSDSRVYRMDWLRPATTAALAVP